MLGALSQAEVTECEKPWWAGREALERNKQHWHSIGKAAKHSVFISVGVCVGGVNAAQK